MAVDPDDLVIFRVREEEEGKPKKKPKRAVPEKPAERPAEKPAGKPAAYTTPSEADKEITAAVAAEYGSLATKELAEKRQASGNAITQKESESRTEAKGLYCVWHSWRPAYAMCAYCHRPFCYEDTTEFSGNYYCLEDIDKVASGAKASSNHTSYNLSYLSAMLLLAVFMGYVYFSAAQLAGAIDFANKIGFFTFMTNLRPDYVLVIAEAVSCSFTLIGAVLLFARSQRAIGVALPASAVNTLLFGYQTVSTMSMVPGALAAVSFAAFAMLGYSMFTYVPESERIGDLAPEYQRNMPTSGAL